MYVCMCVCSFDSAKEKISRQRYWVCLQYVLTAHFQSEFRFSSAKLADTSLAACLSGYINQYSVRFKSGFIDKWFLPVIMQYIKFD